MLSASSRMMILCLPGGRVTFCWANILIWLRTTSMPRSLDAFSSSTASLNDGPKRIRARQRIVVVFPTPGGPWNLEITLVNNYLLCHKLHTHSNDNIGDISSLCKIAESLNSIFVTHNLFKFLRPVLFDPEGMRIYKYWVRVVEKFSSATYQGKCDFLASAELAGAFFTGESISIVSMSDILKLSTWFNSESF